MEVFAKFLNGIDNLEHRTRTEEILNWIISTFPDLVPRIKWNQPMFTDHDTFIIGFSIAKNHLAVTPEPAGIKHFSSEIIKSGYDHSKMIFRIPWDSPVDYSLLERMIEYNILDKAECLTFWRK